jgi:phosphoglycolate phosphatase
MADTPKLCVFDCDGTLVDSQQTIIACMGGAFERHGLERPEPDSVRRVVGLPLDVAIARLHPDADSDLNEQLVIGYRDAFFALRGEGGVEEPLYPGTIEILEGLAQSGWILGIATGKGHRGLVLTLEAHGIKDKFATLQTADRAQGKPSPDMVLRAMEETGVRCEETVMIGDTTFDMEMARAGGVHAVGVAWGYHDPDELIAAGAVTVARTFTDLPAILDDLIPA